MKKAFWLERWEREEIGFHQNEINPYLCEFWAQAQLAADSQVFVPLCGKSRDMLWLREQGHSVLGVELSPVAVEAFFKENGLMPQRSSAGKFDCYEANGISILCGDCFDLNKQDLAQVGAVYDRASLIALPPEMRAPYARHLRNILPPAVQMLLVTLDYPQSEMSGPPFAVSVQEVETLFSDHAEIHLLGQADVLAQNPRFQQRGISRLQESVFRLVLP